MRCEEVADIRNVGSHYIRHTRRGGNRTVDHLVGQNSPGGSNSRGLHSVHAPFDDLAECS